MTITATPDLTQVRLEDAVAQFADGGRTRVKEDETDMLYVGKGPSATRATDSEWSTILVDLHWLDPLDGGVTLPQSITTGTALNDALEYDYDRLVLIDRAIDQLTRARAVLLQGGAR